MKITPTLVLSALLTLALLIATASCASSSAQQTQQGSGSTPATNTGVWFSGSNLGSLTTTPTSVFSSSPQITQAGSYMLFGNVSMQETTGGYPQVTCFLAVGSANLIASNTTIQPPTWMNLTTTGAITLSSTQVPATVSLMCNDYDPSFAINITQASLSIMSVGSLQTGP